MSSSFCRDGECEDGDVCRFFEELEQLGIEKQEEALQGSDFKDSKIQLFTLMKR